MTSSTIFSFKESPKIGNPELQLPSACLLMMFYMDMQAGRSYKVLYLVFYISSNDD